MFKVNITLNTNGSGYWSSDRSQVKIVGMDMPYVSDEGDFGELRVYFDTATWDVHEKGLIYTDKQFIKELRSFLDQIGLPGKSVSYSEQGMQGNNFVSCDVDGSFVKLFSPAGEQ